MLDQNLQEAALHLKQFQMFLQQGEWEKARREWELTPEGLMGEPSILAQQDVLVDHLSSMVETGQFEAAHRAVRSLNYELPGYRKDEVDRAMTAISEPVSRLNEIILLVEEQKFADAWAKLEDLGGESSPWVIENFGTRLKQIRAQAGEAGRPLPSESGAETAGFSSTRGEKKAPVPSGPVSDHDTRLPGSAREATAENRPKRQLWLPAVLALVPVLLAGVFIGMQVNKPGEISQPPAPGEESTSHVADPLRRVPPENSPPNDPPQLSPEPALKQWPEAVADQLTQNRGYRLVENTPRREVLIPLAILLGNDRHVSFEEGFPPIDLKPIDGEVCAPVLFGRNVRVYLRAEVPAGSVVNTVFRYRYRRDGEAQAPSPWAEVVLAAVPAPPLKSAPQIFSQEDRCQIPFTDLFEDASVQPVTNWQGRLLNAADAETRLFPVSVGTESFGFEFSSLWAGQPQTVEIRGQVDYLGETFTVPLRLYVYGTRFKVSRRDCPAGKDVRLSQEDILGTQFPVPVIMISPENWPVKYGGEEMDVQVSAIDNHRGFSVKPEEPFNGTVVIAGKAEGRGDNDQILPLAIQASLTFSGWTPPAPAPPEPDPRLVDANPVTKLFVAQGADTERVSLSAADFAPGGWDVSGKRIAVRAMPASALLTLDIRRDRLDLSCRAPAVLRVEQLADLTDDNPETVTVYAVVMTEKGAVSPRNMRRILDLRGYRQSEEFKSQTRREFEQIAGYIPPEIQGALADDWLQNHRAILNQAYAAGILRGSSMKKTITQRLENIADDIFKERN